MVALTGIPLTIYSDGQYYSEVLTDRVQDAVVTGRIETGYVHLLLQHTTSALMLVEHEAGFIIDLKAVLERVVPSDGEFHHHLRGIDKNGAGHVLSALFNKTLSIPIADGKMLLGTYQEVLFMDFQPENAERTVVMSLFGETRE